MSGGYGSKSASSLPVWTSPRPGILEPLRLPSPPPPARRWEGEGADVREGFCNTNVGRFTADPDVECLLCPETFHHPEQHQVELQTKVREDNAKFYNH